MGKEDEEQNLERNTPGEPAPGEHTPVEHTPAD